MNITREIYKELNKGRYNADKYLECKAKGLNQKSKKYKELLKGNLHHIKILLALDQEEKQRELIAIGAPIDTPIYRGHSHALIVKNCMVLKSVLDL